MAAQTVARPAAAAVKIEEPLEPFLDEAGKIALEFLSLKLSATSPTGSTKAPHGPKDAKGEPGLLRAESEDAFPQTEPTATELPASLPLLGDGGRRQTQGEPTTASGPPPPPSNSRLVRREREREGGRHGEREREREREG